MKPKRAEGRRKGAVGERELAAVLAAHGWPARRGQQRSGVDTADVIDGPPGWHFECKRTEALQLRKATAQAKRDAPRGTVPVVAHRWNGGPWLAIVDLDAFLRLLPPASPAPMPASPPPVPVVQRSEPAAAPSIAVSPEPQIEPREPARPPAVNPFRPRRRGRRPRRPADVAAALDELLGVQ